jgi:hypothetical protein
MTLYIPLVSFSNVKFSSNVTKLLPKSFFNVNFCVNLFSNC